MLHLLYVNWFNYKFTAMYDRQEKYQTNSTPQIRTTSVETTR